MLRVLARAVGQDEAQRRFAAWLLRPYLDLGPLNKGPLHVWNVEHAWGAFSDSALPPYRPQRAMPASFRRKLAVEVGQPQYVVREPRQLPRALQTKRWSQLCDAVARWRRLTGEERCRLVLLLHTLALYECVAGLAAAAPGSPADEPHTSEIAFWAAIARYMIGLPERPSAYADADMSVFEALAAQPPLASFVGFNAAIRLFVHDAKVGASTERLRERAKRLETLLEQSLRTADDFTAHLLRSRYYRALGFLPQRLGDRAEVVRIMDLAEAHAGAIAPASDVQHVLHIENLHALMESRTKEALWLRDNDAALARALKVTELDPYDAKAWLEVGQVSMLREEWLRAAEAYLTAAMLGPPGSAIGRHMAGLCFRRMGHDGLAAFLFSQTLEVDPAGISPRDEIRTLPDNGVFGALKEWTRSTFRL